MEMTVDTKNMIDFKTQIGLQTSRVDKVRASEYQKLKREGILIELDITGSSMFATGNEWAELGVALGQTRTKWMTPGRKFLYPRELIRRLNSIISNMRQALGENTHDIPGFRPYRYLHYKQYEEWVTRWAELSTRFAEIKQTMLDSYELAVDELTDEYTKIAREAFKTARLTDEEAAMFDGHPYIVEDEFVEAVVNKVLSKMPSRERIETEIQASYHSAIIQGADDIAREEARAAQIRQQAEEEELRIERDKLNFEHAKEMAGLEEREKRITIEAMMKAETDRIRKQLNDTVSPLEETFVELRGMMSKAASEMLEQIQKNGRLHGRSAQRCLETLSDLVEMRAIVDDEELNKRVEQLKAAIGPVGDARTDSTPERSTEAVKAALTSISELIDTAREDFNRGPSRFSVLDLEE